MPGDLFKGHITDIQSRFIKILVAGNQTITAKLDASVQGNINLSIGQDAVFQVNENNNGQIYIKPFMTEQYPAELLLRSLEAAGLNASEKNISVVKNLMENGMPIDKSSLSETVNLVNEFGENNLKNIISLRSLGVPVTSESINTINAYNNYEHRMSAEISLISSDISEFMTMESTDNKVALTKVFLETFASNGSSQTDTVSLGNEQANSPQVSIGTEQVATSQAPIGTEQVAASQAPIGTEQIVTVQIPIGTEQTAMPQVNTETGAEKNNLTGKLNMLPNDIAIMESADSTATEKLMVINKYLNVLPEQELNNILKEVADDKDFVKLLKDSLRENLLLEPKKFINESDKNEAVKKIYENIKEFSEGVIKTINENEINNPKLLQHCSGLSENATFINDMNSLSSYVQLPIKLNENNGHSELYVYNRKKGKVSGDEPLTAFMHLDLDSLGATDVYVSLQKNRLSVRFSLDKDDSIRLIDENIGQLEKALVNKGYEVTTKVEKLQKSESVFEKVVEENTANVTIKRYSFDIRA